MKVAIGSDHHGRKVRAEIASALSQHGWEVVDMGTQSDESVDYPDIAQGVAQAVADGTADRGILICGSGIGMAITANKFTGVRAAPCFDEHTAAMARRHNKANILCLSDATVSHEHNLKIVQTFMTTEFEGGRHQRRVDKITAIENATKNPC